MIFYLPLGGAVVQIWCHMTTTLITVMGKSHYNNAREKEYQSCIQFFSPRIIPKVILTLAFILSGFPAIFKLMARGDSVICGGRRG